jgi:hypothetical protein
MRIAKMEFKKLVKSPFLWFIWLAFFALNLLFIFPSVGQAGQGQELFIMHETILDYGVNLREAESVGDSDAISFYRSYVEESRLLYEDLDMLSILERKEELFGYEPSGWYADFIRHNYEKLQERVSRIISTGENDYGFYPGQVYKIQSTLYGNIGKKLLLEISILMALSILFLMDYERGQNTSDIVITTKTGKRIMRTKALMGIAGGMMYGALLMVGTLSFFFWNVPFSKLWNVPVASELAAEMRNLLLYPFITYWRLSEIKYLMLSIAVFIGILLVAAAISIALQLWLQNSYLTFLVQCVLFVGLYRFAGMQTGTFLDVIKAVSNPVSLYITCGAWFMENSLVLSFPGNEFWCIGVSGMISLLVLGSGVKKYRHTC